MAVAKAPGTWTYDDLLALPEDGRRYEIIEGELYEMPAPSLDHAMILANLVLLLGPLVRSLGGTFFFAPLDVFFQGQIQYSRISSPSFRAGEANYGRVGRKALPIWSSKCSALPIAVVIC